MRSGPTATRAGGRAPSAGPVQSAPEGAGGGRPAMASRKPSSNAFELRHTLSKVGLPLIEPVNPLFEPVGSSCPGGGSTRPAQHPGADDGDDLGRHGGLRRRSGARTLLRRRIRRGKPAGRRIQPPTRNPPRANGAGVHLVGHAAVADALKFRDSLTEMDEPPATRFRGHKLRGNDVISARRVAFRLAVIPAKAGIHRLIQAF